MTTYPNQKVIHINKDKYSSNFLQIGIEEWQTAYKSLKPSSFALYLYLAGNSDGFNLALSQKAVEETLGISKSSYHRAIEELEEKGFIVQVKGHISAFNTRAVVPKMGQTTENEEVPKMGLDSPKNETTKSQNWDKVVPEMNREIDKIDKTDKIEKSPQSENRKEDRMIDWGNEGAQTEESSKTAKPQQNPNTTFAANQTQSAPTAARTEEPSEYKQYINAQLARLTEAQVSSALNVFTQLKKNGFTDKWIAAALEKKERNLFEVANYDFRLFYSQPFQSEVNTLLQQKAAQEAALKEKQRNILAAASNQLNTQPTTRTFQKQHKERTKQYSLDDVK